MKTCVVYAHGGSYTHGSGDEVDPFRELFGDADIIKVDYTLLPKGTISGQIRQVTAAVRAAKQKYDRVIAMGYSAGGHLACMAGNAARADGIILIAPPLDFRYVQGFAALNKLPLVSKLLRLIEPIAHAAKYTVPTLIIQGQMDTTVLPDGARNYCHKARNCRLLEVMGTGHTMNLLWSKSAEIKIFLNNVGL